MNNNIYRPLILLLIILTAVSLACGGASAPVSQSQRSDNTTVGDGAIHVQAREFSFALDSSQAPAGEITFVVENTGAMVHDFAIRGDGVDEATPEIEPGESASLTVTLEPGTYTYICTIPGHEQLGMRGAFTVTSS